MRTVWLCCLLFPAGQACGDGAFMGPVITDRVAGRGGVASTEQKGVIIELPENREALLLQTTYHGPADRFAWVIPVPGLPGRNDVFIASPDFMDEVLQSTRPDVITHITDPRDSAARMGWFAKGATLGTPMAPEGAMEADVPGTVVVHERMAVGEFDVAVLSATGVDVLVGWLADNQFQIPQDSADVIGHYVDKAWHFVALRMQPSEVRQRPLLADVPPIGIRFPTDELVYPLYISRASSRQNTALLLVALTNSPVRCEQLREAELPLGKRYRGRVSYATLRRQALEGQRSAAVCEYRGLGSSPSEDLHYEKDAPSDPEQPHWSRAHLWTTRYWALLDLDDLRDLTFGPSEDKSTRRLVVIRRGVIYRPPLERLFVSTGGMAWLHVLLGAVLLPGALWWSGRRRGLPPGRIAGQAATLGVLAFVALVLGPLGVIILVVGGALMLAGSVPVQPAPPDEQAAGPKASQLAHAALVGAGLGGFGFLAWAGMPLGWRRFLRADALGSDLAAMWRGEGSSWLLAALLAAQLVWVVATTAWVRDGLKGARWRAAWVWGPWIVLALLGLRGAAGTLKHSVLGALGWIVAPPLQSALTAVATAVALAVLLALLLLACFMLAGPFAGEAARRRAQSLVGAVVVLVVFTAGCTLAGAVAHAGLGGYAPTGVRSLDNALERIDGMLTEFRDAHGCYPARLADLATQQAPAWGVDSSGNPLPVDAAAHRPLAETLSVDPLTGRTHTWVYEPTGTPMVDSGGYSVLIEEWAVY